MTRTPQKSADQLEADMEASRVTFEAWRASRGQSRINLHAGDPLREPGPDDLPHPGADEVEEYEYGPRCYGLTEDERLDDPRHGQADEINGGER